MLRSFFVFIVLGAVGVGVFIASRREDVVVPTDIAPSPAPTSSIARVRSAREHLAQARDRALLPPEQKPTAGAERTASLPDPRRADAMQRLGRGDNEGSLALLRAMKVDRPDDLEIALFEALALKELRRYSEAKVALERVLDGTPEFRKPWTSLYYYGWVLMNTGDADGSRAAFTAFLEFEPTEGDAYFGLGLLDLERRDLDGAESNFLKAIEHAESAIRSGKANRAADWAKCKARLGEVMFERERFVAARDLLSDSLRLAPQSHEAWYLLHRVYKKLGDAEGAAQALARHQATKPPGVPTNP